MYIFDKNLYAQLIAYPGEIIQILDKSVTKVFLEKFRPSEYRNIMVLIKNLRKKNTMRSLGTKDINHLVSINGIVLRCSEIIPDIKDAFFKCSNCGK